MCGAWPKKCVFFLRCLSIAACQALLLGTLLYNLVWPSLGILLFGSVACGRVSCVGCWAMWGFFTNTLALQLVDTIIYRYDYIPKPCLVIV